MEGLRANTSYGRERADNKERERDKRGICKHRPILFRVIPRRVIGSYVLDSV
jgi:hypothetical protein